ncbi:ribonuclease Z [Candidatus Woesearchaeota archaeon]|nr:ribonuclease Z [Candidatus Woesearchaeota archaeon]
MIEVTFLGTSSMVPTKERNHSAILLSYRDEKILIDCGEGTQRQLRVAGITPTKITKILITHWHGDHVLGLPGLIQTLGANEYRKTLEIYGPEGSKAYFENMLKGFSWQERISIKMVEVGNEVFFENSYFKLESLKLKHSTACTGYCFLEKDKRNINVDYLKKFGLKQHPILKDLQRGKDIIWKGQQIKAELATSIVKGKKIAFVLDTAICDNASKLAKDADLLICEATLLDALKEKCEDRKHLTVKQAAELAKKSDAKQLVLTHFSQRYKDDKELLKEAKSVFEKSACAKDFLNLKL